MLTRYQIESELSLAYLHAVAAKASFAVDVPHIDTDSVDATISAKGKVDASSLKHSPRIEVQLKASINASPNAQSEISYSLPLKNYDDLRADTVVPRLLILLVLPNDDAEWLEHTGDSLILRKCAYYLNLKGFPASKNVGHQTVHIPVNNELSPASLRALMVKASKMEDL